MSEDFKNQYLKVYEFQKSFLDHVIKEKEYKFNNHKHGEIKSFKLQKYLDIYRNNFYAGLINSLEAVFPACHSFLPEKVFKGLSVSLIKSKGGELLRAPEDLSLLFPQALVDYKIIEEVLFIKDLAEYELAEHQFLKSFDKIMYHKSKHPVQELKNSILINKKMKISKETNYFYRVSKKESFLEVTKISKKLYMDAV